MTKDRQIPTTAPLGAASRFARAGYERPVEHLHFDRRARVWWSHEHPRRDRARHALTVTAGEVCA